MEEHNYLLQANLYTESFKRYLTIVEKRPFEEIFGGVFYLFLRGIEKESNQFGVYHFIPGSM